MNFDKLIQIIDNTAEIAEYKALQEATDFTTKSNPFVSKKHLKTAENIKKQTSDRKANIINYGEDGAGTSSDKPFILNYRDPRSLLQYNGEKTPLRTKPDRDHTLNPIIPYRYPSMRDLKKVLDKNGEKVAPFKFLARLSPKIDDIYDVAQLGNEIDDEFNEDIKNLAMGPDGKFKSTITNDDAVDGKDIEVMYGKIRNIAHNRMRRGDSDIWFGFDPSDELAHDNPLKLEDLIAYEYLTAFMNLLVKDTEPSKVGGTALKKDYETYSDFGKWNEDETEEVEEDPFDSTPKYDDDWINKHLG